MPLPAAEASSPNATAGDWPSYNRTLTSERYSQLSQINTKNVGKLKVLCTYDVDQFAAFESGLIMVENALIGTTQFDIFSLNPATCAENWRTREDYPPSLLPANRGAAYLDGMLFRGTQDGRVLAYDFKTGKPARWIEFSWLAFFAGCVRSIARWAYVDLHRALRTGPTGTQSLECAP